MLIAILAVLWIAVLTPTVVRHFRDRDTDRSILNFHERMARLGGKTEPLVEPAHRLDVSDELPPRPVYEYEVNPPTRAPRLRVVPANATPADLERDLSWDDWSREYADDPFEEPSRPATASYASQYRAVAYAQAPVASSYEEPLSPSVSPSPYGSRSQRLRRRRVLLQLVAASVITTLATLATGWFPFEVLAIISWLGLVGFLGLMYYAVTTGMVGSSRTIPVSQSRGVTPTARYDEEQQYDESPRYSYRDSVYDAPRYAQAL